MDLSIAIFLFIAGSALVIFFSEKLVEATIGVSLSYGISTFLVSTIFIGFDPENLGVGSVASFEGIPGIALGSVFGSAMVAITLALGVTALIAPMKFEETPKKIVLLPLGAVLLLGFLCYDGRLSRIDGGLLLTGYIAAIIYLIKLSAEGFDIKPAGEVAEKLDKPTSDERWKGLVLFLLSILAIIIGSELLVSSAGILVEKMRLSETVFGMTLLALIISIEELGRELPAALKGRPEITYGNVLGSVLAFFLFNAGIISLIQPLRVDSQILTFYLPMTLAAVVIITVLMVKGAISRWSGAVLTCFYAIFFVWGYF